MSIYYLIFRKNSTSKILFPHFPADRGRVPIGARIYSNWDLQSCRNMTAVDTGRVKNSMFASQSRFGKRWPRPRRVAGAHHRVRHRCPGYCPQTEEGAFPSMVMFLLTV